MKRFPMVLHPFACILVLAAAATAQAPYNVGDWTSYRDFRFARALDAGSQDLFVATSGGVLQYDLLRRKWNDPIVVGYGLSAAVELDDPILLLFDEQTGYLWLATRSQMLLYDVNTEQWRRVERNLWGAGDRVVNIGVGGSNVYIETAPAAMYGTFFPPGSPLPRDGWWQHVTRYKGSRTFGGFQLDLDPRENESIRWRGLRSKLPLTAEELHGAIPAPPVGFPSLRMPRGWIWHFDGTLLDDYQRALPVTDWIVDRFANLWVTFWGAGALTGDLRTGQTAFYSAGPAGNDVRALQVSRDELWLGGFNTGERRGISRATPDLRAWQFHEIRDDSRIRSTDVNDFAHCGSLQYIATEDGLLAYDQARERWTRYGVQENLFSDRVRALAATDSELWIGTVRGLNVMTLPGREIWRIENSGIELAGVTDLAICGDTLYVGTAQGLFKGSLPSRTLHFAALDQGLLHAAIGEISVNGSQVWLVTPDGVMVYDQFSGESKSWRAQLWLGGAELTSILATDPYVWVGTTAQGFYRYRQATGEWISYTSADGLPDNRVQVIRRDGDDLLIGTPSGLTRFFWNRPGRVR